MPERAFTPEILNVLLHPERWTVIAAACPPEATPVEHPRHRLWQRTHTHDHPHQELMLTVRGNGLYGHRGAIYPCAPGTLFLFDAFEAHDLGCPPWTEPIDVLWVAVLPGQFVTRMTTLAAGNAELWRDGRRLLDAEALGGLRGLTTVAEPAVARLHLVGAMSLLIAAILRRDDDAQAGEEGPQPERIVRSVQRYLHETAGCGVTLDTLARISGYSKYHFLRLFQRYTGQTVHEYIDACRRERAETMRLRGCQQKEIAQALGFSCPSAYSRWAKGQGG